MSERQTGGKGRIPQPFIDVGIAFVLVGSIFLVMFSYTGNWPPLVVVESRSMQHSETDSQIGIMDTGDLTMVKTVSSVEGITSYIAGMQEGYSTYGDYGDVVIYWRAGDQSRTPIIHRAVLYLVANGDSYSAPELKNLVRGVDYDLDSVSDSWERITDDIRLHSYGYRGMELMVPISSMLGYMQTHGLEPYDGFITKGDFNSAVDQLLFHEWGPVKFEWIRGVATGEIPWFGVLKLYLTGSLPYDTPSNSIMFLWTSIGLIAAIPIGGEAYIWWRERRTDLAEEARRGTPDEKIENEIAPAEGVEQPSIELYEERK